MFFVARTACICRRPLLARFPINRILADGAAPRTTFDDLHRFVFANHSAAAVNASGNSGAGAACTGAAGGTVGAAAAGAAGGGAALGALCASLRAALSRFNASAIR